MNLRFWKPERKWFLFFLPPENWRVAVLFAGGVFAGLGLFLVYVSNAPSYLSDSPETCVNCHIMAVQYASWSRSSHHRAAVCNDCHLPHDNVVNKFFVKASNGYYHSKAFTLMNFHEPIRIKPSNAKVLEPDLSAPGAVSA